MKYTILINQAHVFNAGLHTSTDLIDWAILDYIKAWQVNPKAARLDDHVWINYNHLIKEMPLLGLNSKGAVSNRIAKLRDLNLIGSVQDDFGRLFIKTSQFFSNLSQHLTPTPQPAPIIPIAPLQELDKNPPVQTHEPPVNLDEHPFTADEHSDTYQINLSNPPINNNPAQNVTSELSPVVVEKLEKTFSKAELPAAKKLTASIPATQHIEVLAVFMMILKTTVIRNKIGYFCGIIKKVQDGTFTSLPASAQPVSTEEIMRREKIKAEEAKKRCKVNNVDFYVDLFKKYGEQFVPEAFKQAVFEQMACCG
jgi:hypothetical protein